MDNNFCLPYAQLNFYLITQTVESFNYSLQ